MMSGNLKNHENLSNWVSLLNGSNGIYLAIQESNISIEEKKGIGLYWLRNFSGKNLEVPSLNYGFRNHAT